LNYLYRFENRLLSNGLIIVQNQKDDQDKRLERGLEQSASTSNATRVGGTTQIEFQSALESTNETKYN
jgi:hypothetical protein